MEEDYYYLEEPNVIFDDSLIQELCQQMDIPTLEKFIISEKRALNLCKEILNQKKLEGKIELLPYNDKIKALVVALVENSDQISIYDATKVDYRILPLVKEFILKEAKKQGLTDIRREVAKIRNVQNAEIFYKKLREIMNQYFWKNSKNLFAIPWSDQKINYVINNGFFNVLGTMGFRRLS